MVTPATSTVRTLTAWLVMAICLSMADNREAVEALHERPASALRGRILTGQESTEPGAVPGDDGPYLGLSRVQ
jgi:hypothetical protein